MKFEHFVSCNLIETHENGLRLADWCIRILAYNALVESPLKREAQWLKSLSPIIDTDTALQAYYLCQAILYAQKRHPAIHLAYNAGNVALLVNQKKYSEALVASWEVIKSKYHSISDFLNDYNVGG